MKLIVGLGNPGKEYARTRHNVGWLALDELAKKLDFPAFKEDKKMGAEISAGKINTTKVLLAKPQTFMNRSGEAVAAIAKFYKIKPADIWIIQDDLDMPLGKIRVRNTGSSGGHKGIESIIRHLKTGDFSRMKIGIKPPEGQSVPAEAFVLQKFRKEEEKIIKDNIKRAVQEIETALES